jgi:tetratricopeptide (TPR) repeat protein
MCNVHGQEIVSVIGNKIKVLLFLQIITFAGLVEAADDSLFRLLSIEGSVERSSDGSDWVPLEEKTELMPGTWLKTSRVGAATLLLPDNTQTRIGSNTILKLNIPQTSVGSKSIVLSLSAGKVWSRTNRVSVDLKIKIPGATASVRGTEWVVEVTPSSDAKLSVLEGSIALKTTSESVQVQNGQSASVKATNGAIRLSSLVSSDEIRQFIYRYKLEPLAYMPKGEIPNWAESLLRLDSAALEQLATSNSASPLIQKILHWEQQNREKVFPSTTEDWLQWVRLLQAEILISSGRHNRAANIISSSKSASKPWLEAKRLVTLGRFSDAENELKKSYPDIVNDGYYWLLFGVIKSAQGQLKVAKHVLTLAEREAPWLVNVSLLSASVELRRGNYQRAEKHLKRADELGEPSPEYLAVLTHFYTLTGDMRKAASLIKKQRRQESTLYPDVVLADSLVKLKSNDTSEALDSALEATALDPNFSRAQLYQGIAHLHRRETKLALKRFEDASELDPLDPLPNLMAAKLLAAEFDFLGSQQQADIALGKVVEERGLSEFATDQTGGLHIGRRYYELGLPRTALISAQLQFNGRDPASHIYEASVSPSDFYSTSQFLRGMAFDSQVIGVRRDYPDGISRDQIHGFLSAERSQMDSTFGRYVDGGVNGYGQSRFGEISFLVEGGKFDQKLSSGDSSGSEFSFDDEVLLSAFGWRPRYGHDFLVYRAETPFYASVSDQETKLEEDRLDFGYTNTADQYTNSFHWAQETSNLLVDQPAAPPSNPFFGVSEDFDSSCRDKTTRFSKSDSLEFVSLIDLVGATSLSIAAGQHLTKSNSLTGVSHNAQLHCYVDIDFADPVLRDDLVERLENIDQYLSFNLSWVYEKNLELSFLVKAVEVDSRFTDSLITEYGGPFADVYVLENINVLSGQRESTDYYGGTGLFWTSPGGESSLQVAIMRERKPVASATISATRLAGLPPLYDWLHPDGTVEQATIRASHKITNKTRIFVEHLSADLENNPVFSNYYADQQSAREIRRISKDRFRSPVHYQLLVPNKDFEDLSLRHSRLDIERPLDHGFTGTAGIAQWEFSGLDAERISKSVPSRIAHVGFSLPIPRGMMSIRFLKQSFTGASASNLIFFQAKRRIGTAVDVTINAQAAEGDKPFLSLGVQGYL